MDELWSIELLRQVMVMLGKHEGPLPENNIHKAKSKRHEQSAPAPSATSSSPHTPVNYISDDEDEEIQTQPRRSKRIKKRTKSATASIALWHSPTKETATAPPLVVDQRKLTSDYQCANLNLQLDEWTYKTYSLK